MNARSARWLLPLLLATGCAGSGVAPGEDQHDTADVEETATPQEGGEGAEQTADPATSPAQAKPAPVVPVTLELGMDPARPYYRPGQLLQLEPVARDVDGARALGVHLRYTVSPAQAVSQVFGMPGRYELLEEGLVSFEVCAREGLCAQKTILIDADSPSLVVSEPAPGAQLGGDGSEAIVVKGSVADTRPVRVWVGEQPVELDEMGRFEASVPGRFGINALRVRASDGVSPESEVRLDVLWAPAYLPLDDEQPEQGARARLAEAARLSLGQPFFDDAVPVDPGAEPLRTEDVADLVALIIERAELGALLPDPLVDGGDALTLRVTDVRPRAVSVDVDLVEGAVEMFVRVGELQVDSQGGMDLEGTTVSLDGGLDATLSVLAQLRVTVDPEQGLQVSLADFATLLESVRGRFDAPEANAVFKLAGSSLRSTLEGALSGVLADALVGQLPAMLQDALGSLEGLLRDQSFELDFAPLPAQTVGLDGRFSSASITHGRHLRLGLDLAVSTDGGPAHPMSRGVAQTSAQPALETFDGRAMQLAVRLDAINMMLHTLWNGGLLDIDGSEAGGGDLAELLQGLVVSGQLPPVLRPAHPWEAADAMLEVGQLELLADVGELSRYGLSLALPVRVALRDGAIVLDLETPAVEAWLIESTAETPLSGEELVQTLVPLLLPALEDLLGGDGIKLDLPSLSPGELTGIAPSLEGLELSLAPGDDIAVRGDALVVDLQLIGNVP